MNIDKLMIYVQGCTTLSSFKDDNLAIQGIVKVEGSGSAIVDSSDEWNLYGGDNKDSGTWYEARLSCRKKENFNINAKLTIDKGQIGSGYALVVYGEDIDNMDETLVLSCSKKNKKWDKSILLNGAKLAELKSNDDILSNFTITIDRLNGTISAHHIGGEPNVDNIKYEKIKNLKGIKIRIKGCIKLSDIKVDSNKSIQINEVDGIYESYFNYTPDETKNININIRGRINSLSDLIENAKIIFEFVY